ncbi:hypothetical protein EVAR_11553_1 [Eumeta japonica]|uniref:Uncharacterized protein n=1 Tax=Eumeta variegata TaxID=151549 RepID=A0A4C1TZ15_EUMVA|nr:hypothetical protein EVAR_11553_1 [Eumeta japonica]
MKAGTRLGVEANSFHTKDEELRYMSTRPKPGWKANKNKQMNSELVELHFQLIDTREERDQLQWTVDEFDQSSGALEDALKLTTELKCSCETVFVDVSRTVTRRLFGRAPAALSPNSIRVSSSYAAVNANGQNIIMHSDVLGKPMDL